MARGEASSAANDTDDQLETTPPSSWRDLAVGLEKKDTVAIEFLEFPEGTRVLHGFLYSLRNKKERKYELLNIAFVSVEAT